MKIKLILVLFFSFSQLLSHSQISSDQYFRNFRTLKKTDILLKIYGFIRNAI